MTSILLSILMLVSFAILAWSIQKKERIIQFPFFAAGVFLGWVMPKLMGLTNSRFLPEDALDKVILMAIFCVIAAWWGYVWNQRPAKLFRWRFDRRRLLKGSAVLSILGAFFFYKVSLIAADITATHGGAWTGIITIYVFFSKMLSIGMIIAIILYLIKPAWPALVILSFDLLFYMDRIVIKGRRSSLIELGLMVLFALWFYRRWLPPRWGMLALLFIGALVINSAGDYRATMLEGDRTTWSGAGVTDVLGIDFLGNIARIIKGDEGNQELLNATMSIEAADRHNDFDFGLSHWNAVVQQYIPGQWLGHDFKESLYFNSGNLAYSEFFHTAHTGSTSTGLTDAYLSFWYFGAVKFFFIGLLMSRWFKAAEQGNVVAQIIIMYVATASLTAITHSTHEFFTLFLQLGIFLLPVLLFSRIRPRRAYQGNNQRL